MPYVGCGRYLQQGIDSRLPSNGLHTRLTNHILRNVPQVPDKYLLPVPMPRRTLDGPFENKRCNVEQEAFRVSICRRARRASNEAQYLGFAKEDLNKNKAELALAPWPIEPALFQPPRRTKSPGDWADQHGLENRCDRPRDLSGRLPDIQRPLHVRERLLFVLQPRSKECRWEFRPRRLVPAAIHASTIAHAEGRASLIGPYRDLRKRVYVSPPLLRHGQV